MYQIKSLKIVWILLLISNENKSHYVISKIVTDLCAIKQKIKIKNIFCKCCSQCFSSEKVLIEHKENCLILNGKQNVKLKSSSISFKN